MLEQFALHAGTDYPDDIRARLGFEEQSDIEMRQKYIWGTLRKEWISFYVWRWQRFWTKVAGALQVLLHRSFWDAIYHVPTRLEKDMYVLANMYILHHEVYKNTSDGYAVTLGDGIVKSEWDWVTEREELAYGAKPVDIAVSSLVWSEAGHYALLEEYIQNRRPSVHKQFFEAQRCNASLGAAVRVEELDTVHGAIFVPNFDLLAAEEKEAVCAYNRGTVICTAPIGYCSQKKIECDACFGDEKGGYRMEVFVFGLANKEEHIGELVATREMWYFQEPRSAASAQKWTQFFGIS